MKLRANFGIGNLVGGETYSSGQANVYRYIGEAYRYILLIICPPPHPQISPLASFPKRAKAFEKTFPFAKRGITGGFERSPESFII